MKTTIVIALIGVLLALGAAGLAMLRKGPSEPGQKDARMARALAARVGLSIVLFLFILLAWKMGWVQPTGLPMSR